MKMELTKEDKQNFEKANMILTYIFSVFNLFIIIFVLFIFSSQTKNIRFLKLKLFGLIFIDSISLILYSIIKDDESLTYELFFSVLYSIEFYIYISFLYQIFNNTEISKLSKGVELISPFQIFILFILIIFSYYKFSFLYREIVNCIQYILILSSLILLYKYFNNTIKIISSHLKSNDIKNRKIYYYLKILNNTSLILLFCYIIIKIIIIFVHNQYYKVFLEVGLNTINQGLKYFIFILFEIIIYTLNNKIYKINFDETIGINQK